MDPMAACQYRSGVVNSSELESAPAIRRVTSGDRQTDTHRQTHDDSLIPR